MSDVLELSRRADTDWQMPDSAPHDGKPVTLLLSSGREVDQAWWGVDAIADSDEDDGLEGWRDHKGWVRGEDESVIRWRPWRSPLSAARADTVEAAEVVKPETRSMIDEMVAGTAPMSRWMASVDYSTFAGFEKYLEAQLRDVLNVKAALDGKGREDEELSSFIDGRVHSLDSALATYRVVMQREASTTEALSSQVEGLKVERDEALERVEELEGYGEEVANEFEKDCWKAMRKLLDECGLDWSGGEPVTAEDAREFIHEELKYRKARAEKAEASHASQAIPEGFMLAPKELVPRAFDYCDTLDTCLESFWCSTGDGTDNRLLADAALHAVKGIRSALAAIPAAPEVNK